MTQENELIHVFKENKALLEGHFLLSSGQHSNQYWQSALLLQNPKMAEELGKDLAKRFLEKVDAVVSPALGGLIIGHEVARAKGCRAIFTEKTPDGISVLRRGFQINPRENVLVIEDVVTTGLSTSEVVSVVDKSKGNLIGIGCIVSRSESGRKELKRWKKPVHCLLEMEAENWHPDQCPLCKKSIPFEKPGSRK